MTSVWDVLTGGFVRRLRSSAVSLWWKGNWVIEVKLSIHWSIFGSVFSYGHELWVETKITRSQMQSDKMSLHQGGWCSLKNVKAFGNLETSQRRAAAPPHSEKPDEVEQASGPDAYRTSPWVGVLGMSQWAEFPGKTQDTLLDCLSAGLGTSPTWVEEDGFMQWISLFRVSCYLTEVVFIVLFILKMNERISSFYGQNEQYLYQIYFVDWLGIGAGNVCPVSVSILCLSVTLPHPSMQTSVNHLSPSSDNGKNFDRTTSSRVLNPEWVQSRTCSLFPSFLRSVLLQTECLN